MKSFKEMAGITEAKIFNPKGKIGKKTISLPISAKDETEAEAKFIKRVELEQKNGNAPKGDITDIIVEADLNEAVDAMKVFEYYKSTFENVKKAAEHELDEKRKLDKMNRRILSDYAGNPGKLKEIYKQLTKTANELSDNLDKLDSIIG